MHGLYQIVGDSLQPVRKKIRSILHINVQSIGYRIVATIITFLLAAFAFIFFRAESAGVGLQAIKSIFTVHNPWILFDKSLYECGLNEKNFILLIICLAVLLLADICKMKGIVIRHKIMQQNMIVRDLIISLITLKYTQSNSVCFAYDGQAIGVGAGQQSRIHCTRLAASKADTWFLRQYDKVLNLPFLPSLKRAERDNLIDGYINKNEEDVCAEGIWQKYFTKRPEPLLQEEARAYLDTISGVSLGSDAFFPFSDNIERAKKSGVSYVAQPGGSIRDDDVIATCNKYDMIMAFTGMRLFHH